MMARSDSEGADNDNTYPEISSKEKVEVPDIISVLSKDEEQRVVEEMTTRLNSEGSDNDGTSLETSSKKKIEEVPDMTSVLSKYEEQRLEEMNAGLNYEGTDHDNTSPEKCSKEKIEEAPEIASVLSKDEEHRVEETMTRLESKSKNTRQSWKAIMEMMARLNYEDTDTDNDNTSPGKFSKEKVEELREIASVLSKDEEHRVEEMMARLESKRKNTSKAIMEMMARLNYNDNISLEKCSKEKVEEIPEIASVLSKDEEHRVEEMMDRLESKRKNTSKAATNVEVVWEASESH
jgi:hypothetical protein